MNSMEARTRVEGLLDKRDEILNSAANVVAKFVADRSNKTGAIDEKEINTVLSDFTADERYLIMVRVINILAKGSVLKVEKADDAKKKSSYNNSIFASRGYN